jgi:hypothetical protein
MHLLSGLRTAAVLTVLFAPSAVCEAGEKPSSEKIGYNPLTVPNACLPDSIGFRNAYEVYQRNRGQLPWSRLLVVYQRAGAAVRAHAYCVFEVEGKLWAYDQVGGSQRAWLGREEKNDAAKLGKQLATRNFVRAAWVDSML